MIASDHFQAIVPTSQRSPAVSSQADPLLQAMPFATARLLQTIKFLIEGIAVFNTFVLLEQVGWLSLG